MFVDSERGILSCFASGQRNEDRALTIMPDATIRFYIHDSVDNRFAYTPAISANTWTHLVGTFDGTDMKVYLN